MKKILDFFKSLIWETIITIVTTLLVAFFSFLWNSVNNTYEVTLKSILVFISLTILVFWLLLLLISILSHFKEMSFKRRIFKKLTKYVKNNDAVKSIQFYEIPKLLRPSKYKDDHIDIGFKRIGGISDESFETNSIINDSYVISTDFYTRYYYDVFEKIKSIDKMARLNEKVSDECLLELFEQIGICCTGIKNKYLDITSVKEIKPEHYFYYRTLYVLTNKGAVYAALLNQRFNNGNFLKEGSSCKIDRVLEDKPIELENALKHGRRSQYLGALMTGELFVFYHEPNSRKENRSYFSSLYHSLIKRKDCLMVVTFDSNCLSVLSEYGAVVACERMRDEISRLINRRKEIETIYEVQ